MEGYLPLSRRDTTKHIENLRYETYFNDLNEAECIDRYYQRSEITFMPPSTTKLARAIDE